jgi:CheY-like chemotaxis protein
MNLLETKTEMLTERAVERSRRLILTNAIWSAGGLEDAIGLRTIQAELTGLAQELRVVAMESLAEALDAAASSLSSTDALKNTPEPLPMGRRILVLDDSEVTCDLIAVALEGVGCLVTVCSTLSDALQRFVEFEPELVLIEPTHPDFGGTVSLESFRKRLKASFVPMILFSAETEATLAKRARELQADGFLTKDQGIPQMVRKVDEILSEIVW